MSKKKEKPCFMEDIYRKHERLMYYIAGKYSEVSVQREDIVQTAVLSLLKNEATLQRLPPYAQINYIAAAVRNTAINTIKRDQKEAARCIPLDDLTEDFSQAHIPGAEDVHKTLETLASVWQVLSEKGATRHSLLINLGGGMVTDLGGFAAATFKRGIAYINIPTTLLAMVDASVGGKTGINFNGLKNEIGLK